MTTTAQLLLDAVERMELTEQGWIEKVTHPAHGRTVTRVLAHLLRQGIPEECLYDNTRLAPDADGLRYIPDLFVVLPDNPVAIVDDADYAGAPDLIVEVLSPGEANERRDREEKRRRYAQRGVAHYWVVDPADGSVTDHHLTHHLLGNRPPSYSKRPPVPLAEADLRWLRHHDAR